MLLGAVPIAVSIGFEVLAVTGEGMERSGASIVAYSLLRFAVALVLLGCCLSAGLLLRHLALGERFEEEGAAPQLICSFALGASAIALAVFAAGFAGLLYRPAGWVIASPLIASLALFGGKGFLRIPRPEWSWESGALTLLACVNVAAALFLLVYRALFPSEIDGDVWEHYLHYYYEATQRTHSLAPSELWYQFYLSKGATLQILATLLSDVLGAPLVSWCFIVLTAAIAYDLTKSLSGSRPWGLVASLCVLEAATLFNATPNLFKHHMVFGGLVAFVGWCVVRGLVERTGMPGRTAIAAAGLTAFYTSVYIPVGGAILVAALAAVAATMLLLRVDREHLWLVFWTGVCAAVGMLSVLALNYASTGLALDSPIGVFWRFVDLERFARFWDPLVLEYWFIGTGAVESAPLSLGSLLTPNFTWLMDVLRLRYLMAVAWLFWAAVAVGAVCSAMRRDLPRWRAARPAVIAILVLAAYTLGTLSLANVFPASDSVYRLYAFSFSLLIILMTACVAMVSRPALQHPALRVALPVGAAVAISFTFLKEVPAARANLVLAYASGAMSMRDVLTLNDRYSDLPGGFGNFLAAKKAVPEGRILYMGYSPSPGYLLPLPPLLSEPSYSFGSGYGRILYGDAVDAQRLLKAQDVDYFLINMRSRLFLGIPYSELFQASRIPERLGLHWQSGEFYLLTWKEKAAQPLPESFVAMLDLKQRSMFAKARAQLGPRLEKEAAARPAGLSGREALQILEAYLLSELRSEPGRRFASAFSADTAARLGDGRESAARHAERLLGMLRAFAARAWGEPIASDMWNLRLSEDIQSQDFGWLYDKNRSRYSSRQRAAQ